MAVYTDITDEELAGFLAGYDLGAATAFKGIAEGVENSNFLLETEAGRFILTVYERRVRPEELPYFLGLMSWLADHDFPSARPVPDREGRTLNTLRGKPAAIAEFMHGLSVRRPTVAHCRAAGGGLARLHEAAADYPGRRVNDLGQPAWAPMFARLHDEAENLKPGLAAVIDRDLAHFEAHWERLLPGRCIGRRHRLLLRLRRSLRLRPGDHAQRLVLRAGRQLQRHRRRRHAGRLPGGTAAVRRRTLGLADPRPRRRHALLPDPTE